MSKLNKRKVPNIVRGGYAQPLGNDLYMLHGAKHEQGGIDIGSNPKTGIEAEGGEVVQMKPNELRVLSAQPMLGGDSPAQLAVAGANPDKVFDAQEKFKDRHGLRDDGTYLRKNKFKYPKTRYDEQYNREVSKAIKYYKNADSKFVNTNNDTISVEDNVTSKFKTLLSNEKGNAHFINNLNRLTKQEIDSINKAIKNDPVYPIMVDNGRYMKFYKSTNPAQNYRTYTMQDLHRDDKDLYILGTKEKRNGGMIEINGNVKNGLIMTPRSQNKCGGRKKAELGTRDYNPATRGGIPVNAMPIDTLNVGLVKGLPTWMELGTNLINELRADDANFELQELAGGNETPYTGIDSTYVGRDPRNQYNSVTGRRIANRERYRTSGINLKNNSTPKSYGKSGKLPDYLMRPNLVEDYSKMRENDAKQFLSNFSNISNINIESVNRENKTAKRVESAPSPTGSQTQTETSNVSKSTSSTNSTNSSKPSNRKTITDARVSESWRNTIGDDADVLNYIANGDAFEHKKWQDRHSKMTQESGYKYENKKAVYHKDVSGYSKDFNEKFNQANKKLGLYTTPAGKTGDNQYGEKRNGGRIKAESGTVQPYTDDWYGAQVAMRHLGKNADKKFVQEQINARRLSPLKRAAFERPDGYLGVIDEMAAPKLNGLDIKGTNKPDLSKLNIDLQKELPNVGKRAATKALYGEPKGNWRDEIGLGLGLAGGILDPILRGRKLRDMRGYTARLEDPVKLKTKFNINPQLDATKQAREQAFRDIDANTASSATALARKQNTRNQSLFATNQLWGQKENIETQLINQDKMNLQGVRNRNTTRLNQAGQFNAQVRNTKLALQADNISNGIQNVVNAGLDYLGRKDDKERYKNTLAVIQASNPNVSPQQPAEAGFDWGGYRPSQRRMYGSTAKLGLRKRIKLT